MADYTGTGEREGRFKTVARGVRSALTPSKEESDLPLELTRVHHVYAERADQMQINLLSVAGGKAYVNNRLSRFSGESNIDWTGGERADGGKVQGRKQQSHCFPYAGRIVGKISQHVFSVCPSRENITDEVEWDASADGKSLNDLMLQANDYVTACQWCWMGVDAPALLGQVSQAEKAANKIRPYIQVYSPLEVVDWKFDGVGGLEWLITEGTQTESTTPDAPETSYIVRRIWTRGEVRTVKIMEDDRGKKVIASDELVPISYQGVPFVLVGSICAGGHAFDDIESVNRTIMDLESVNRANFYKRCYPQLVLPSSCIENVSDAYASTGLSGAEMIVGLNYPILISKDDPIPQYLTPSAADMGALRAELDSLKRNMFESVGLMLQSESRQIASAESKAWDFLDVAMVMKARAQILEDAENKVAEIVNKWDSSIPLWDATYNRQFDIGNFQSEMNALIMAVNAAMPKELYRVILHKILDRIDRVGASITNEQREAIELAIEDFDPRALSMSDASDISFGDTLADDE